MRTIHPFHREGWNAHGVLDSLVKEGPDAAQEVRLYHGLYTALATLHRHGLRLFVSFLKIVDESGRTTPSSRLELSLSLPSL